MVELVITGLTALAVGSFVAGKIYGARVEAKAIAAELNFQARTKGAYAIVVLNIRAFESRALARVRKFLS